MIYGGLVPGGDKDIGIALKATYVLVEKAPHGYEDVGVMVFKDTGILGITFNLPQESLSIANVRDIREAIT